MESQNRVNIPHPLEALVGELFQAVGILKHRQAQMERELIELKETVKMLELEGHFDIV